MGWNVDLGEEGYRLALEIRDGKWDHVDKTDRASGVLALISELRRRCPGFTDDQYSQAIANGLSASR